MHLLVIGLGYTGIAIAGGAAAMGWRVTATSRTPDALRPPLGVTLVAFGAAGAVLPAVTHVVQTAAPTDLGDPALLRFGPALAAAPLRWAGYLSTTGVYGDRNGEWVDEDTAVAPTADRARRRVAAEEAWVATLPHAAVDLFRLAGIYGPGRSAFDEMRAGRARRVVKPGHMFGRIHRDDIAAAVLAAAAQFQAGTNGPSATGRRVLNLTDDEPASSADVTAEAARLLGMAPPPLVEFADALPGMSEMGRSFWSEHRRVRSVLTQERLGLRWRYPTYREGLRAILQQELAEGKAQQQEVRGPR